MRLASEFVTKRITIEDVAHVARLACLELSADEIEAFAIQLAAVLDHIVDIETLDLEGVEPTSHPLTLINVLRSDEEGPTLELDEIMNEAPFPEDEQFRVPPVLGEAP